MWGLILGISSIVIPIFLNAIAGAVLSGIGLAKEPAGKTMAIWGLVTSVLGEAPATARQSFTLAARAGILSSDLADELAPATGGQRPGDQSDTGHPDGVEDEDGDEDEVEQEGVRHDEGGQRRGRPMARETRASKARSGSTRRAAMSGFAPKPTA